MFNSFSPSVLGMCIPTDELERVKTESCGVYLGSNNYFQRTHCKTLIMCFERAAEMELWTRLCPRNKDKSFLVVF